MTWTERRTRRRLGRGWIAVLLALVLVAGACGDDDDGGAASGDGSAAADGSGSEDGSDDGAAVDSGADGSADAGGAEDGGADDGATDGSSDDGEAVTPTPGGSATFLVFSEITSFDPIQMTGAGSADGNRALAVYDQLLRLDNATGEIAPHIAESFEPNEDYSVWTLKIRPGVLFSDGTPYDAAAVKFNWEYMRDTEGSRSAASTANMVELNVIDDLTLEQIDRRQPDKRGDK